MKTKKLLLLFLLFFFFSLPYTFSQEKFFYLQHRFDGFTEIIHKTDTKEKLTTLKHELARMSIVFSFNKLTYNQKNEITGISLKLKNKKSSASLHLTAGTSTIPTLKITEINGVVSIGPLTITKNKN